MKPNQVLKELKQEIMALEQLIIRYESFSARIQHEDFRDLDPKGKTEMLGIHEDLKDNKIRVIQVQLDKLKEQRDQIIHMSKEASQERASPEYTMFSKKPYRTMRMDEDEAGCNQCCTIM
jgi:hypothetical protein